MDQLCYKGPIRGGDCWPSIGEAFTDMHDGDVFVESGVTMAGTLWKKNGIVEALAAVQKADQVVLAIGEARSPIPEPYPPGPELPLPTS